MKRDESVDVPGQLPRSVVTLLAGPSLALGGPRRAPSVPTAFGLAAAVLVGLAATPAVARAQEPDLVRVSGSWTPRTTVTDSGSSVEVGHLDAALYVPIPLDEHDTVLFAGLRYGLLAADQQDALIGADGLRDLHSMELGLGLVHTLSPRWGFLARGSVGLSGDFVDVDDRHFRFSLGLVVNYRVSETLALGGGLDSNWQLGQLQPLPALLLVWRPSPDFSVNVLLPRSAQVSWHLTDRVTLGLLASNRGDAYGLGSSDVRSGYPCESAGVDNPATPVDERVRNDSLCVSQIAYSRGEVGPVLEVRLVGPLWLTARASVLFFRRYEAVNQAGGSVSTDALQVPGTAVVEGGLRVRLPEDGL